MKITIDVDDSCAKALQDFRAYFKPAIERDEPFLAGKQAAEFLVQFYYDAEKALVRQGLVMLETKERIT